MTVRKNIIAGWLAHLITVLIGFFLMPFILGTVGEAQYGAWVFINAIAGYSTMIYAGFGSTICRYVADLSARREWNRLNAVVSTIQLVYVGTASLVFLFTALFAWFAPGLTDWGDLSPFQVQGSILIIGGTIGLGMIASVYGGVLTGTQRLDIQRGIEVGMGILRLVLTVYCLQQRLGLITLALIFLTVTVVEHACSACFAYRQVPTLSVLPWHARRDVFLECFSFSAFSAVALLAEYLIFFTDTVVIGLVLGPLAVVPYQIGQRIAQMIRIPVAQIGEAVLPKAGELYARRAIPQLGGLVAKAMGLAFLLAGGFFIGSWYFGELLIRTWMGKEFGSSATVLVILVAAQLVSLPTVVTRKALLAIGQVRLPAFIDLGEALLNLVLSLILIQFWGVVGVAWGTLIPLTVVEIGFLLPYAARQLDLSPGRIWREVVAPQLPALAGLFVFCEGIEHLVPLEGWGPLLAVTAGGGLILAGLRWLTQLLQNRSRATPQLAVTHTPEALPG